MFSLWVLSVGVESAPGGLPVAAAGKSAEHTFLKSWKLNAGAQVELRLGFLLGILAEHWLLRYLGGESEGNA